MILNFIIRASNLKRSRSRDRNNQQSKDVNPRQDKTLEIKKRSDSQNSRDRRKHQSPPRRDILAQPLVKPTLYEKEIGNSKILEKPNVSSQIILTTTNAEKPLNI